MLFSDASVATFINDHFEPAWETVRDVPFVTINFGSGRIVRRTLHGNIATSVCAADGTLLDVLPGIYEPEVYRWELTEFSALHRDLAKSGRVDMARVTEYHRAEHARLTQANDPTDVQAALSSLELDTRINEKSRRRVIHGRLAKRQCVTPRDILRWLYRDVLNTDIDDPYLGLSELLFEGYPFGDEDGVFSDGAFPDGDAVAGKRSKHISRPLPRT